MPRAGDFSYLAEGRLNAKTDCGSTNTNGIARACLTGCAAGQACGN
jgi:hypothetical protein